MELINYAWSKEMALHYLTQENKGIKRDALICLRQDNTWMPAANTDDIDLIFSGKKKLVPFQDWNAAQTRKRETSYSKNGVACPKCSQELYDDHDLFAKNDSAKEMPVICMSCDHTNDRVL